MSQMFVGRVIGTKMDKTAKVSVVRLFLNPNVIKFVRKRKTYFAHDEENQCHEGDLVMIKQVGYKISKRKSFKLVDILERTESYTHPVTGQTYYQPLK